MYVLWLLSYNSQTYWFHSKKFKKTRFWSILAKKNRFLGQIKAQYLRMLNNRPTHAAITLFWGPNCVFDQKKGQKRGQKHVFWTPRKKIVNTVRD